MTATNSNYSDPNNLMFEEIKILGSLQEITAVTVSQNNVVQNSPHNITYYPSEKVTQEQENRKQTSMKLHHFILYIAKDSSQASCRFNEI